MQNLSKDISAVYSSPITTSSPSTKYLTLIWLCSNSV